MSRPNNGSRAAAWKLWRRNGLIWAGLMLLLLLLLTLAFNYVPGAGSKRRLDFGAMVSGNPRNVTRSGSVTR